MPQRTSTIKSKAALSINRLWPGDIHMRQLTRPSLSCHLFATKPSSQLMVTYFQLHPKDPISMSYYLKIKKLYWIKCIQTSSAKRCLFVSASVCKQPNGSIDLLLIYYDCYRLALHDDVIKWKHFPRYRPFVLGIHRLLVNSPKKANDAELRCFYHPR